MAVLKGDGVRCSFCYKAQLDVKMVIAGPAVYICDECIDICNHILAEDIGLAIAGSTGTGTFGKGADDALVRCRLCQTVYPKGECGFFPDRGWLCHRCLEVVRVFLESAGQPVSRTALDDESEQAIDRFAEIAGDLCSWLEGNPSDDSSERFTALRFLASLYDLALQLPEIRDEHMAGVGCVRSETPEAVAKQVMRRLDRFPARSYWRVDRSADGKVENVEDDIARDLFLTYSGVRDSLGDFKRGGQCRYLAAWSWRHAFWLDWGRHASNAIQALHAEFHEEANRDE